LKVTTFLNNLVFIGAMTLAQAAFAECASVGMMGGCVPAAGMVDVPTHMKSQIVNRVVSQKTTPIAQNKTSNASAGKKAIGTNIAVASATQSVQK
jgi:hypothetical protein